MGTRFYTVQPGDNLSTIGQQFGVPWSQIAKINRLNNPDKLQPNDVLMIPEQTSEEDRLRIDAAKAAPAGEAARAERPSQQTPPSPGFDVVDELHAKTRKPQAPLPNREAQDLATGPEGPQGVGTGSLENIKDTTKPYPPGPSQLGYGSFWTDFLNKELPTAVQGATGPGAAFMRAAAKLKDFAGYPYAEPNAARANFYRKAGRSGVDLSQDPNYGQVFEQGNTGAKPETYSGPNLDQSTGLSRAVSPDTPMTVKGFLKDALLDMGRKLTGARPDATTGDKPLNPRAEGRAMQFGSRTRPVYETNKRNLEGKDAYSGPGSSYAKGTTATKSSEGPTNPMAKAIQAGMQKRFKEHGYKTAGDVIDLHTAQQRRDMSQAQKYSEAVLNQKLNRLMAKPEGSWTDDDFSFVKQLLDAGWGRR